MTILKKIFVVGLKGTKLFRGLILLFEPEETFVMPFKPTIADIYNSTQFISDLHFQKQTTF